MCSALGGGEGDFWVRRKGRKRLGGTRPGRRRGSRRGEEDGGSGGIIMVKLPNVTALGQGTEHSHRMLC